MFLSEEVFERTISEAVEQALYEARATQALEESREDFREDRYYSSREELMAAVERKRSGHAAA